MAATSKAALEISGLHVDIGRYRILQGVDLVAPVGETTVILGRNGAGKTTTLRTAMGLLKPRAGGIVVAGQAAAGLPPFAVARLGVGYVPEDRGIFSELTVRENLLLAERRRGALDGVWPWLRDLFPDLERFGQRRAGALSGGQQQMLALARALINDNQLLLIDEPSKGLAPVIVQQLARALGEVRKRATIVLVEQNLALAAALGDHYVLLEDGRTVGHGRMAELMANDALKAQYLGLGRTPQGGHSA